MGKPLSCPGHTFPDSSSSPTLPGDWERPAGLPECANVDAVCFVPCVTPLRWLVNSRKKPECVLGNLHPGNLSYLDVLRKYISFQKELLLKPCVTPSASPHPSLHHIPALLATFDSQGTDTVPASGLWYSLSLPLPLQIC